MSWMKSMAVLAGMVCLAPAAHASTAEAWGELFSKAGAACLKAADLKDAKLRGQPVDFQAVVLLIVDGRHPQPHMKNAPGTRYCLYDKQSGKTEMSQAETASTAVPASPAAKKKLVVSTGRVCWTDSFGAKLKSPRPVGSPCTAKNDEGDAYEGVVRR